jgi:HEAT repeat protein
VRGEATLDRPYVTRLCTHVNTSIRLMAFEYLAPAKSLGVVSEVRPSERSGEVVALPTFRAGRSPLDQIRLMLTSGEAEEMTTIAASLSEDCVARLIPDLVAALDVPDMGVRRAAIETLGQLGTEVEVPLLLEAARRLRGLAGMVVRAIRQIGELDDPQEIAVLFDRRLRWADEEAVDDLVALAGERAATFLGAVLHTRFYPPVRIGAARAMARHGMRETIFALRIRALTDPHAEVRGEALEALKSLTGSTPTSEEIAGYGPLTTSLDVLDQAWERAAAAGPAALPGLRATLAKGTWRRRMAACKALLELRCTEAGEALYDALTDIDEDVRLTALHSLRARGWKPETPVDHTLAAMAERRVDQLVKSDGPLDIETLAEGLFLGGHIFRTEIGAVLSRLARQAQWQPNEDELAAWAVTRLEPHRIIDTERGLDTLLQLIDRTWQVHPFRATLAHSLRLVPVRALGAAIERHEWRWRTREAICRALARPGCPTAPSVLSTFILDTDEDVRCAALASLVSVGTTEAARCVSEAVSSPFHDDAEAASHALAAIGEPALEVMRTLADSTWWEARRLSALALRGWRGDRNLAVDLALPLAVDPEYRVAEAALEALRRHGRMPSHEAVLGLVPRLQALTVHSVLQWLPIDASGALTCSKMQTMLCAHADSLDESRLPYFLGVLGTLRVRAAVPRLEALLAPDAPTHAGVRACASEALRILLDPTCGTCEGRGAKPCVRCEGMGEERCEECSGRGAVRQPCPELDCNARALARAIGSAPCKTCRGRGSVVYPCNCGGGTVRCTLCQGTGSLSCPICEGVGEVNSE